MKVSLIILTLNELDGMKIIMPQIKKEWYDQLIVVDGGSTDGTIEYARENGYCLLLQKKSGMAAALDELMEEVTGDIIITFSPDGNSMPENIPPLIEKMKEGYDIVVVSRYLDGAKSYDDTVVTAFGNWMFAKVVKLLFRVNITDLLVMFRAFKKSIVNDLEILPPRSGSWSTQLLLRASKRKLKIGEIPGDEPPRIGGISKLSPVKHGLLELETIVREFLVWR